MKYLKLFLLAVASLVLTACGSSGFHKANDVNSSRFDKHYDSMLSQVASNLMSAEQCYLAAAGGRMLADGSVEITGSKTDAAHCSVMSMGLQTTSTLMIAMAPYIVKEAFSRVPASPEEIMKDIVSMGFKFALSKYGIEAVTKVVNTGQLASYRIAQSAMAKNPIVMTPGVINTTPEGASVLLPGGAQTVNP